MIVKTKVTEQELKTLRDAQRIVEDMRIDNLFGEQISRYMLQAVSGGLSVIINEKLQEMRGD